MLFFRIFSVLWISVWLTFTVQELITHFDYYRGAMAGSSPQARVHLLKSFAAYSDFFTILDHCDRNLPAGEKLQIILPKLPSERFEYLSGKARYLLYPRNDGNNAARQNFILVYLVANFQAPPGYVVVNSFGPDKYLLARGDLQAGKIFP